MSQILVRATQPGFHGTLRAEGDTFLIDAPSTEDRINPNSGEQETVNVDPFAPSWMEKVEEDKPKKALKADKDESK